LCFKGSCCCCILCSFNWMELFSLMWVKRFWGHPISHPATQPISSCCSSSSSSSSSYGVAYDTDTTRYILSPPSLYSQEGTVSDFVHDFLWVWAMSGLVVGGFTSGYHHRSNWCSRASDFPSELVAGC
jgi:hypothetical protein